MAALALFVALALIVAACGGSSPQASHHSGQRAAPVSLLTAAEAQGPVTRQGSHLMLAGRPWTFDGIDAYTLASDRGQDVGCGPAPTTAAINDLFSRLRPGTAVRVWAFQTSMAVNPKTGGRDWTGLDRVVAAARAHGVKLILSLASQAGTCDGGAWKGPAWYTGGYAAAPVGAASAQVSYEQWVTDVVTRYRGRPAVAMYEPVNEPEASTCAAGFSGSACYGHTSCPSEAAAAGDLHGFFTAIGGEIHRLDPHGLVEEGTIGSGQCGTSDTDYRTVGESAGLDVLSVHDYSAPTALLAGDAYNGQKVRLRQAAAVGKPIIAGEIGIYGSSEGGACPSLPRRAADLERKVDTDLHAGYAGALTWDYQPTGAASGCSYDLGPADPFLTWLTAR